MNRRAGVASVLGLVIAGCATAPAGDVPQWYSAAGDGTGAEKGPTALWGLPSTLAFHALRCNARERTLKFEDIEVEAFEGGRPVRVEAGGEVWSGEERMEPADAVPGSSFGLPIDHPVVSAIARGAPMRISGSSGSLELSSPGPVRSVVRECRSKAGLR